MLMLYASVAIHSFHLLPSRVFSGRSLFTYDIAYATVHYEEPRHRWRYAISLRLFSFAPYMKALSLRRCHTSEVDIRRDVIGYDMAARYLRDAHASAPPQKIIHAIMLPCRRATVICILHAARHKRAVSRTILPLLAICYAYTFILRHLRSIMPRQQRVALRRSRRAPRHIRATALSF